MASRALPDLVARIRLDSSGVDEAVSNLTGTFGKANLAMAGVAAGLGLIVIGMRSAIQIAEDQDAANRILAQSYKGPKDTLSEFQAQIADFISKNSRFISSQAEVTKGFASFLTIGEDTTKATRDMGIALDLSTLKHIPLAEAVRVVTLAEQGRFRGLADLGISIKGVTAGNLDQVVSQDRVTEAMKELADKTRNGRDAQTELEQSSHQLSNRWQTLSEKVGPRLLGLFNDVLGKANQIWDALDRFGKDDKWWKGFNDGIMNIVNFKGLKETVAAVEAIVSGIQWLASQKGQSAQDYATNRALYGGARAGGGPVLPGSVYTVGEQGPEKLVMGPTGGYVVPNSGGGGLSKVTMAEAGDMVALLRQLVRNTSQSASFSTAAYGRS